MTEKIDAYPLSWPIGRRRTTSYRQTARFSSGRARLDIGTGAKRLMEELRLLGATDVVISSNVRATLAGTGSGGVSDPGVAVYFSLRGRDERGNLLKPELHCVACDKWNRVADNLAAIAKDVEAQRGRLRWGVVDVMQAFAGFKALPPSGVKTWRHVLGVPDNVVSTFDQVKDRYRQLVSVHHPDRGGSGEQMAEINAAFAEAERELRR